jgi:hypothetical protein
MISFLQVSAARWLDVLDCMGHPRNSWFAAPESAVLADDKGCHYTSNCVRRARLQVCAWLVSQDRGVWKIWLWLDIVLQFSTAAAAI